MQITEDRKKRVIDLYFNQHKTYAEIAQIERMSPRDISPIIKEEQVRRQKYKQEKQQQELSSKAYELFSKGKLPVEVAIALNITESKVSEMYREYWNLRGLHKLNSIYIKTNGKIWPVWKLYQQLVKKKGMNIAQVVNVVEIAIHKLPYMESLYEQVKDEVDKMQRIRQQLENYLHNLKEEIASAKSLLNSYHMLCECKRQELENINTEASSP